MLNALFGVAYGLETPFFPQLAAPNLAPRTELYRTCTKLLFRQDREDYCARCGRIVAQFDVQAGFGWMRNA